MDHTYVKCQPRRFGMTIARNIRFKKSLLTVQTSGFSHHFSKNNMQTKLDKVVVTFVYTQGRKTLSMPFLQILMEISSWQGNRSLTATYLLATDHMSRRILNENKWPLKFCYPETPHTRLPLFGSHFKNSQALVPVTI